MKHSAIIQENLDKRKTKKEKCAYLLYAYKEWAIAIGIGFILVIIFVLLMGNTQTTDLTVRIISELPVSQDTIDEFSAEIQAELGEETTLDIQNFLAGNTDQEQMLTTQMTAQEIDLLALPEDPSDKVLAVVDGMIDENNIFTLDGYSFSSAFNAPHADKITNLKKGLHEK